MNGALVIFSKTIGLSPVKTRLSEGIGEQKAEAFYKMSLRALEEVSLEVEDILKGKLTPYWAVAEWESLSNNSWRKLDRLWTGDGDLGQRLNHVYTSLLAKHDYVIIIGSDSPQIGADLIFRAAKRLQNKGNDFVVGPCLDGGFYLFGGSKPIKAEIWNNVVYSKSDTLEQLLKQLQDETIFNLEMNHDVDEADDLLLLKKSLLAKHKLLPNQQKLLDWLNIVS